MRPAVLSISAERVLAPIRNAVLAHAGYGVIPVSTVDSALKILRARHVCAIVIANSVSVIDRRRVCSEGHNRHVPSVVLDPYDQPADDLSELHVNPLDGPEAFLMPWQASCSATINRVQLGLLTNSLLLNFDGCPPPRASPFWLKSVLPSPAYLSSTGRSLPVPAARA